MPPTKPKRRTLPSLDRVLALQIRALRDKRRVSQQQLAEMLGETQSTIARIESGERSIAVSELFRIAAALDCAPVYLLSGELTGEDVPVAPKHRLTCAQVHEWIVGIWPLPGADRRAYLLENISDAVAEQRVARAWLQPQKDAADARDAAAGKRGHDG